MSPTPTALLRAFALGWARGDAARAAALAEAVALRVTEDEAAGRGVATIARRHRVPRIYVRRQMPGVLRALPELGAFVGDVAQK